MVKPWQLSLVSLVTVLVLVAALAWLTRAPDADPCSGPDRDIAAAVLADQAGDQDALVNRAIIQRGRCAPEDQPGAEH